MNALIFEPDIYQSVNFKKIKKIKKIYLYKNFDKKNAHKITVFFIGLKYQINQKLINNFPNLKFIVTPTTGVDHINIKNEKIKIINLNPKEIIKISATAEHTLLLLLIMVKKIPQILKKKFNRTQLRSNQLFQKKILIIGKGRIGSKLGKYCKALGMKVFFYNKSYNKKLFFRNLSQAEFISININYNLKNRNFFNHSLFKKIKSHPYIINTSRPNIVDRDALYDALDKKIINGYAMDFETFDNKKKLKIPKKYTEKGLIFTTPHIAGNTHESINIVSSLIVKKFLKMVEKFYIL
jgi:D-3-phosphoglycerate dehydrogenase